MSLKREISEKELFLNSELYREIPSADADEFFLLHVRKSFESGETVILESLFHQEIHLLVSGKLQVYRVGKNGDMQIIANILPGQSVGEFAVLNDNHQGRASVRALEKSVTLRVLVDQLIELCDKNPNLGYRVFRNLSGILASRLLK